MYIGSNYLTFNAEMVNIMVGKKNPKVVHARVPKTLK
jgi:hypothetical protein